MIYLTPETREEFWDKWNLKLNNLWSELENDLWTYFKSCSGDGDDFEAPLIEALFHTAVSMQKLAQKRQEVAEKIHWETYDRLLERKENDALEYQLDGCLMSFDELEYEEAI